MRADNDFLQFNKNKSQPQTKCYIQWTADSGLSLMACLSESGEGGKKQNKDRGRRPEAIVRNLNMD